MSDDAAVPILSSATIGVDPDPKNPWSDKSTMNKVVEYMYFGLPSCPTTCMRRGCRRRCRDLRRGQFRDRPWPAL
ncbi:MAG: hypothetical protein WDN69_12780 [Aliidongia sp.]